MKQSHYSSDNHEAVTGDNWSPLALNSDSSQLNITNIIRDVSLKNKKKRARRGVSSQTQLTRCPNCGGLLTYNKSEIMDLYSTDPSKKYYSGTIPTTKRIGSKTVKLRQYPVKCPYNDCDLIATIPVVLSDKDRSGYPIPRIGKYRGSINPSN